MTLHQIQIRKCNVEDLEVVAQLDEAVFGSQEYCHLVLRQLYEVCGDLMSVAVTPESEIVGYTLGCPKVKTSDAWILVLAITPQWRRKGIARKLNTNLLNQLAGLEIKNVWLTVEPDNKAAINLYSRMGFKFVMYENNYFGKGSSRNVMRKTLYYNTN